MRWIDEIIEGLFDLYKTLDPFDICDHLGIRLRKVDSKSVILRNQPSMYYRDSFKNECIFYASGLRYKRLKFYILHELGHALLHPNLTCSALTNGGKVERQANYFAVKMMLECGVEKKEGLTVEYMALENDIPLNVAKEII
jgi:Zn-dependent peptidase ImmA (M78 family)